MTRLHAHAWRSARRVSPALRAHLRRRTVGHCDDTERTFRMASRGPVVAARAFVARHARIRARRRRRHLHGRSVVGIGWATCMAADDGSERSPRFAKGRLAVRVHAEMGFAKRHVRAAERVQLVEPVRSRQIAGVVVLHCSVSEPLPRQAVLQRQRRISHSRARVCDEPKVRVARCDTIFLHRPRRLLETARAAGAVAIRDAWCFPMRTWVRAHGCDRSRRLSTHGTRRPKARRAAPAC